MSFSTFEVAILQVLRKYPNGLRYNALHRECNKILRQTSGTGVCIRTFNKYLKKLVEVGLVERNEETRFEVSYRLNLPETSQIKEFRQYFQELLLSWRERLSQILEISKTLVQSGFKEKEDLERLNPEIKTIIGMTCGNLAEIAGMVAKQGVLMTLMFEATNPAFSRLIVKDFSVTMQRLFEDVAGWIETAGKERFLLLEFFRDVGEKFVEEEKARGKKMEEKMRKFSIPLPMNQDSAR